MLFQLLSKALVDLEGGAQRNQAGLLAICRQHRQNSTQQLSRVWPRCVV